MIKPGSIYELRFVSLRSFRFLWKNFDHDEIVNQNRNS